MGALCRPGTARGTVLVAIAVVALAQLPASAFDDVAMSSSATAYQAIQPPPPLPNDYRLGIDTNTTILCGSGPYYVPKDGNCANGNLGLLGGYFGGVGGWKDHLGCGTQVQFKTASASRANTNFATYGEGVGAGAFFMAGGPGRDPSYDGTTSEAFAWGEDQARTAASEAAAYTLDSDFLWIDVETTGSPDSNGWNTRWNGCGSTVRADHVLASLCYQTFLGFVSWIWVHTPYWKGVYSAGGSADGSWSGIMGSATISETSEWTYVNETNFADVEPNGFSVTNREGTTSASWFAGAPTACHEMWQWSGGNDTHPPGGGDYDQIHTTSIYTCDG